MQDLNDKSTGDSLTAAQWNQVPSEIQNVIEGLGISLSAGDLNQLGKGIAGYVANGTFYTDSGAADAYVLTKIGIKQTAPAYTDGFEIAFIPDNTNTGASTVNVAGLGVKSIKLFGADMPAGFIEALSTVAARYDGTDFQLIPFESERDYVDVKSGRKNLLINSAFRINQRVYVSGAATSGANEYTLDRWRVVVSGQSITFSALGTDNTITCPAGGFATEVEALDVVGGEYVISWEGTATCEVGGIARTVGESFTLTANTDVIVEFSGGTLKRPQLEKGSVATDFEFRLIDEELASCQRYFQKSYNIDVAPGTATSVGAIAESSVRNNANEAPGTRFPTSMKITPTVIIYSEAGTINSITNSGDKTASSTGQGHSGIRRIAITAGTTASGAAYQFTADAEL